MTPQSFSNWQHYLKTTGPRLSDAEMDASARLVTVLLCGEQSAIRVFAAEVREGRAPVGALQALAAIERDEQLHEQALQSLCAYLPPASDQHSLRRRAQRFFAGLGRVDEPGQRFARISHLDSAVCKIMYQVERSAVDHNSPLRYMASEIKRDEARHVGVSRRYAALFDLDPNRRDSDAEIVTGGLIDMLSPLTDAFETIGVDSDRLFSQIHKAALR